MGTCASLFLNHFCGLSAPDHRAILKGGRNRSIAVLKITPPQICQWAFFRYGLNQLGICWQVGDILFRLGARSNSLYLRIKNVLGAPYFPIGEFIFGLSICNFLNDIRDRTAPLPIGARRISPPLDNTPYSDPLKFQLPIKCLRAPINH